MQRNPFNAWLAFLWLAYFALYAWGAYELYSFIAGHLSAVGL